MNLWTQRKAIFINDNLKKKTMENFNDINRQIDFVEYNNLKEVEAAEQEYTTRILYFKTDFKGSLHVPNNIGFHPNLFVGTQKEYDEIYNNYLTGKEDEFKIIGVNTFNSLEDYNKKYSFIK